MRNEDFELAPCPCGECRQAGVSEIAQRRDPQSGRLLHGHDLRRWYEAKNKFAADARVALGKLGMPKPVNGR